MSNNRFNLIDESWIPIQGQGPVSLREIFSNQQSLQAIGGNAVQKISLIKLLLAIIQRAWTPQNDSRWKTEGISVMAEKTLKYLEDNYSLFYLYGDRPFLQRIEASSARKMTIGTGEYPKPLSEDSSIVFFTQIPKKLSEAQQALFIVSLMNFSLGGIGHPIQGLNSTWAGYKSQKGGKVMASSGPGTGTWTGNLHSFALGSTLLETLWINVLTEENIKQNSFWKKGLGTPPWELLFINEDIAQDLKDSYMGCLVGMSRFVLLAGNDIHYAEGIRYPSHKTGWREPSISLKESKKCNVKFINTSKKPWREITSLLSFFSTKNINDFKCQQLEWAHHKAEFGNLNTFGIWSGGLGVTFKMGDQDPKGKDDFVSSEIIFNLQAFGSDAYAVLIKEMANLEELSKNLEKSIRGYFKTLGGGKKNSFGRSVTEKAMSLFWNNCEEKFHSLIAACESGKTESVYNDFTKIVESVYNIFCSKESNKQLISWAKNQPNTNRKEL
jgi:CRISPR system Cascade subunit CasA